MDVMSYFFVFSPLSAATMIDTEDGPAMLLHSGMLRVHEAVYRDDTWLFYMDGWKWQLFNTFAGMYAPCLLGVIHHPSHTLHSLSFDYNKC